MPYGKSEQEKALAAEKFHERAYEPKLACAAVRRHPDFAMYGDERGCRDYLAAKWAG